MIVKEGGSSANICLWNVVLEEGTWDIMKRLQHQWTQLMSIIGDQPPLATRIDKYKLQ